MGQRERLVAYIEKHRDRPFELGVHDCLTFSNGAYAAYHGCGFGDDWLGGYMGKTQMKKPATLKRHFGFETLYEALDARLERVTCAPPTGSLVTTLRHARSPIGGAMGIAVGAHGYFVAEDGLIALQFEEFDAAWGGALCQKS